MAVTAQKFDIRRSTYPGLKEREIKFTWALLRRFQALLNDYFGSLIYEFLPSEKTCQEWEYYMMDLQQAIDCVVNQLTNCDLHTLTTELGKGSQLPLTEIVKECDRCVTEAIAHVDRRSQDKDPGVRIAENIVLLQKLAYILDREMKIDHISELSVDLLTVPLQYACDAKAEYENNFRGLEQYLAGTNPTQIECFKERRDLPDPKDPETVRDFSCTISRLVFLKACLSAFMAPNEWIGESRNRELVNIQECVRNQKLSDASPHRFNVGHRLSMIKQSKLLTGSLHTTSVR
jgi:hypothetical protein